MMPPLRFTTESIYLDRSVLLCSNHGLETGNPVDVLADGCILPMGLVDGLIYWAITLGTDRLQIATTYQNALDGTPINLTGPGASALRPRSSYSIHAPRVFHGLL